jgi:DNA-binding transcriptional LysR family regulator
MLSLYKLEIFNAVATEGSFSRAAERLLLSQPAVSQHVRDLEASLGRELFRRGNRGVTLTDAGELLLETTRSILRLVAEVETSIAGLDGRVYGPVAIGATPGAGVYLLPGWIQSFRKRFPAVMPLLRTATTAVIAAEVSGGRLDLGVIEGELASEPPLRVQPLREIELRLVVGENHPLWELAEAPITALDGQAFIARPPGSHTRAWTDQLFSQNSISPQIVAEFDNPEGIIHAVAAGLGISLLPDWVDLQMADGGKVRLIPIAGLALHRTLKLLWAEDRRLRPPAQAFLTHLSELFPVLKASYQGSKQS